jgi:hypothetical protein
MPALWQPCLADVAAVKDQPVVRVTAERLRHDLVELGLDFLWCLAAREAGPVTDAKDVRVDRESLFAESGVKHHVRSFSSDARKSLKFFSCPWHLAPEFFDERPAESDDVLCLGVEETNALDCIAK